MVNNRIRTRLARGLQARLGIPYTEALRHVNVQSDSGELPPRDPDLGDAPAMDALAESYRNDER